MPRIRFDLLAILLVTFSGSFGFGLVIPFLIILVIRFGGNGFTYGLISAMYPFCQAVASPLLGRISDSLGRKPVLVISQSGTLVGWVVLLIALFLPVKIFHHFAFPLIGAFSLTLPLTIVAFARSIDGLTGGDISVAQAYIADISQEKERAADYGKLSIASNIGFIIGPALAGLLSVTFLGEKLPIFAAIIVSIVTLFFTVCFLPESFTSDNKKENKEYSLFQVLSVPGVRLMIFLYFIMYVGYNFFYAAFPIYATTMLQWSVTKMGIYFSFLSVMLVIFQGPLLSRISKKYSDAALLLVGTAILASGFFLLPIRYELVTYLAAVLFALGTGIMWPSVLSLLSKSAGKVHQGTVQGWAASASSVASIIGLLVGGTIFTSLKGNIFYISTFCIMCVFLFSRQLFHLSSKQK